MALEKIADNVIETDVLVVGGGIGGCPTAAKAAEHGLKVTLVEKANTRRSGCAGVGCDHYQGAFPRGMTPQEFLDWWEHIGYEQAFYGGGPFSDPTRLYRQYANTTWAMEELEKLGVTMRWNDGELRTLRGFGREPYRQPFTRVHWMDVKPQMAAGVRERGVNVLERTQIIDLLTNKGAVVGATALGVRTGEFTVIKAKATVIATGFFARCFEADTPQPWKYKFRYHMSPAAMAGDGWAVAYRAGAELANMEQAGNGFGPLDDLAISFGNIPLNEGIPGKVFSWDGEEFFIEEVMSAAQHTTMERRGKLPIYFTIEHLPEDYLKRIEVAYVDERLISLKIAGERGFNPGSHWYEAMHNRPNALQTPPGISADADFKASMKGLFAVGDCVAGSHDVANASTAGFLVGDSIHNFIDDVKDHTIDEDQVANQKERALAPLSFEDGTDPLEVECTIRDIVMRHEGAVKAEGYLMEALRRIGSLRRVFMPRLRAKNPHHLMRCLECRNIMDLTEAHLLACLERKESRGDFTRFDYPDKDPAMDDLLIYQRLENGNTVFDKRKVKPLNMDLREGR